MKHLLRNVIAAIPLVLAAGTMAETAERGVVNFAFDSDNVSKEKYHEGAARLAKIMNENEWLNVLVIGYADSTGSEHYNDHLSQRRAEAVVDKMVNNHGIARDRFDAVGLGISNPVASNDTEEGRAQNRRAEAIFHMPSE